MRIHPTLHVTKVKPLVESPLVLVVTAPLPPRIIDGEPAYMVN